MKKVFISYTRQDIDAVKSLYGNLLRSGFRPWLDKEDLLPGQNWDLEIQKAIRESDFFLACLSKNSVNKRGYVQKELRLGLDVLDEIPEREIFLIPVRLEACEVLYRLSSKNWVDLFEPDGFDRLVKALQN